MPERDGEVNPANINRPEGTTPSFVVEGQDLKQEVEALSSQENLPTWRAVYEETLAFAEGLEEGSDSYDLDDPETLADVYARFTSVEYSMIRPTEPAEDTWRLMLDKVQTEIRGLKTQRRQNPNLEAEIKTKEGQLRALKLHVKARKITDRAYLQRMETCGSDEEQANLLGRTPRLELAAKPDKGDWRALFQGQFGQGVDQVLRRIVAIGMSDEEIGQVKQARRANGVQEELFPGEFTRPRFPVGRNGRESVGDQIYAQGFKSDKVFKIWLKDLLGQAGGRMDVVWTAWRLAELWELTSEFGVKIGADNSQVIGNPPVVSGLMGGLRGFDEGRMAEYGLNAAGQRVKSFKHVGKTGLPFSIGKIGPLAHSFLHSASIKPVQGEGANLWSFWQERGVGFHEERFPWMDTETENQDTALEDFGPGSFEFWLLQRKRAAGIAKDLTSIPPLNDIGKDGFFRDKVRNWEKVFGERYFDAPPEQHPGTLWMMGLLMYYSPKPVASKFALEERYISTWYTDRFANEIFSNPNSKGIDVSGFFRNAHREGFLRKTDIEWIAQKLGISVSKEVFEAKL